jgi:hypothetical protein
MTSVKVLEDEIDMLERIIGASSRMKFGSGLVLVTGEDGIRRHVAFDGLDSSILEENLADLKYRLAAMAEWQTLLA